MAFTEVFLFHTQSRHLIVVDDDPDAFERALLVGPLRPLNGGEPVPETLALELLYLFGGVRVECQDAYVIPPVAASTPRHAGVVEELSMTQPMNDTSAATAYRLH